MTSDLDSLLRQFLDGDLPAEAEAEALRRIADDAEARALLRFELQARDAGRRPVDVPSGFADRTMDAIQAAAVQPEPEGQAAPSSLWAGVAKWWRWLTAPRMVRLRPSMALATAVLLMATAISLWPTTRPGGYGSMTPSARAPAAPSSQTATSSQMATTGQNETVWTRFMYANNEADSVAVAGDFSGWKPIPLAPETVNGQTVWTGMVPVPRGEHQYMFVVNGSKWVTDPLAPVQRADGFGNQNAVLQL